MIDPSNIAPIAFWLRFDYLPESPCLILASAETVGISEIKQRLIKLVSDLSN